LTAFVKNPFWEFSGGNSQFIGKLAIEFNSCEVFTGQIKESLCLEELNLLYQKIP